MCSLSDVCHRKKRNFEEKRRDRLQEVIGFSVPWDGPEIFKVQLTSLLDEALGPPEKN
jgi:hypothetical protein